MPYGTELKETENTWHANIVQLDDGTPRLSMDGAGVKSLDNGYYRIICAWHVCRHSIILLDTCKKLVLFFCLCHWTEAGNEMINKTTHKRHWLSICPLLDTCCDQNSSNAFQQKQQSLSNVNLSKDVISTCNSRISSSISHGDNPKQQLENAIIGTVQETCRRTL